MRFKRSIFLLAAALVGVLLTVQMFAAFNTAEAGLVAAPVSVESAAAVDVAAWETITFDSNAVTYTLTGFGGADDSTVVVDPTNAANNVAKVVKSGSAELWAGTTVSTGANQSVPTLSFTASDTTMTVRVWSPDAGIQVRLKVEDAADNTKSVETEATTTVANDWETLTFDFANQATGTAALNLAYTYNKVSIFFNFGVTGATAGEKTYYFDDVAFGGGMTPPPPSTWDTITFDSNAVTYTLTGFGGADDSTVVVDPTNAANNVAKVVKSGSAELWAGTTVSTGANQSVPTLSFTASDTTMTVRVWSPDAGIQVRLKVEDAADNTKSVETEATTTVANDWETLTFDFANQATGTAALNLAYTYNKVSIFFNFGVTGATAGEKTYYFDDVAFGGGTTPPPPSTWETITFDSNAVTYTLTGFGGADDSTVVVDPTNAANNVAKVVKSGTAELWAGTTVSTGANQSVPTLSFTASDTTMTVRVWSPDAGIQVRLKVEDAADNTKSVETEATTTVANDWETLTFDFANQATGTAALNLAYTYNKISIFFNFGVTGATAGEKTYYFDDVAFGGGTTPPPSTWDTITFDSNAVTYTLTGFGGADDSTVVVDPTNAANNVAKVVKSGSAELWAGTTVSTGANQSVPTLSFTASDTTMTVRVWSPDAGIQVRLKVEDAADNTKSVETEATTTVANDWETLTFDFANQATGTAALNLAYTYNKVSIFFNFGVTGATAGEKTYYFDDVAFGGGTTPPPSTWDTITFDSNAVTYTLTGFGGADDSTVVVDPTNAANNVAKVVKSGSAELWAGTTVSTGANQSVPTLSFTASDTTMTVRVWSPDAGIQVRLKVEDAADNTKSVETEATTTVANDWETLTFDFANQATGTAALNLAYTYNKVSIFFNFGVTGATAGEKTYYFDDVAFGSGTTPPPPATLSVGFSPKSYSVYEGEMATVTVALNMTSTNTVTVTYATADGTATAGADYTATTGSLVFAPGDLAKSFTVATTDDADEEPAETVNLTLSAPISVALGSASTAVLTIKDNDQVPPTVLAVVDDFENGLPTGLDGNGLGIGFVTWGNGAPITATVAITTPQVPDSDPLALPGQTGNNHLFKVEINAPGWGGTTHAFENAAVDTWTHQDWSGYAGITFWLYGQNTGHELLFEINENRNPGSTTADTQIWSHTIVDDFSGWQQIVLNFSTDFKVKNIGNGAPTDDFTREQVHGWAFGSLATGGSTVAYYLDNVGLYGTAAPAALSVGFSAAKYSVTEGDTAVVTVSLNMTSTTPVTVTYKTAEGQATPNVDYTPVSGTLVFAPGEKAKTVSVPTLDDAKYEGNEAVMVNLYDVDGAALGFQRRAMLTIVDNEVADPADLGDFEGSHPFEGVGGVSLAITSLGAADPNAMPGQGMTEQVLTVEYNDAFTSTNRILNTFTTPQDWSGADGLSFWYFGNNTGKTINVELWDNQITATNALTATDWTLRWADEFNEAPGTPPNPNNWQYEIGDGTLNGIPGWGNDEFEYYTDDPANASTDGEGNLVISLKKVDTNTSDLVCYYGPCRYTSARLKTENLAEFQYGKIEARMKLPPTNESGIWPAFWSLGSNINEGVDWPQSGEIDIMEYVSKLPNEIFGTLHGPGYSGGVSYGKTVNVPNLLDGFHTYTIEWWENHIIWSMDGVKFHEARNTDAFLNGKEWVYNHPFFLLLNVAIGGNFGGTISPNMTFPQDTLVDYVRVYQAPLQAELFEAGFVDNFTGWQRIYVPFSNFARSADQFAGAPDDGLTLTSVNGYGFRFPSDTPTVAAQTLVTTHIDQVNLVTLVDRWHFPMIFVTKDSQPNK